VQATTNHTSAHPHQMN